MSSFRRCHIWYGGACVLLVALLSAWFLFSEDTVDWTGRERVTIVLTKKGFEPERVYITRGTRVAFISERGNTFWPASDLHPFHTIYPEFDPGRPLSAKEEWEFVLEKDGRWHFHDHIDPTAVGLVVVVPPGERGGPQFDVAPVCDQKILSGKRACWKEHIALALEREGLSGVFEEIRELHVKDSDFARDCHRFAHDVGLLANREYGDDIPLIPEARTCGQGFYHGYMEGFLVRHSGDVVAASHFCERVGEEMGSDFPLAGPQCHHGIGHGQMEYLLTTNADLVGDLPRLIGMGIDDCAVLPDDDKRFRCASGTYSVMKDWVNIQELHDEYADFFTLDSVYALCRYVSEEWARRACAWELSKEAMYLTDFEPKPAFAALIPAGRAWAPEYLTDMVRSAAFFVGEYGVSRPDEEIAEACASIHETALRAACIDGIVSGLLFNGRPEDESVRSAQFCHSPQLTLDEQRICSAVVVAYLSDAYGAAGRAIACAALEAYETDMIECSI